MFLKKIINLLYVSILICIDGCKSNVDLNSIPVFSENNFLNCVIEIPAGTNKKIEYIKSSKEFKVDKRNGLDRIIEYLPYPGNYGFIPSTYSDPKISGDGDPLDVIVISETLETGMVIEAIPIAMLKLIDNDEYDYKIICIPADKKLRVIDVNSLKSLSQKYPTILNSLEIWFLNYDKKDPLRSEGWVDEKKSMQEIKKSML